MVNLDLDPWLASRLVCPRDRKPVEYKAERLACPEGHDYACIDGIPIMLRGDVPETHPAIGRSLAAATQQRTVEKLPESPPDELDPFVLEKIGGTCGRMYRNLGSRVTRYPIPPIRLPQASGQALLDVGCGWGRWTVSAARKGYLAVGIDPTLEGVRAARRVARKFEVQPLFVVGDARYLPFADDVFDVVYSYGVLQHFSKPDVRQALTEIGRILKPDAGHSLVQMAVTWGLHNLFMQARRGFRARGFNVRYWSVPELRRAFADRIGPTRVFADGYFCLDPQPSDLDILPTRYQWVVRTSEWLRGLSERMPWMTYLADSVYIESACRRSPG